MQAGVAWYPTQENEYSINLT
ncbi:hypothetical protein BCEP27_160041 [Burkholderia cepacia]